MSKARDLANAGTALTTVSATELGYLDGVTSAVQTQIDSKIGSASAINPTIVDAKGDIIAATAADTVARLAVGSNDTILTADSSTATGLKWAAIPATTETFTLLNAGGTSLSGSSTTVSSLSGYNTLKIMISNLSANGGGSVLVRFNSDTSSAYVNLGQYQESATTYNLAYLSYTSQDLNGQTFVPFGYVATAAANLAGAVIITGANSTSPKMYSQVCGADAVNGNTRYNTEGVYTGGSVISSITVSSGGGSTFDSGKIYIYGGN